MTQQPSNGTERSAQGESPAEPDRPGEVRTTGETAVDDAIGAADDPE